MGVGWVLVGKIPTESGPEAFGSSRRPLDTGPLPVTPVPTEFTGGGEG